MAVGIRHGMIYWSDLVRPWGWGVVMEHENRALLLVHVLRFLLGVNAA